MSVHRATLSEIRSHLQREIRSHLQRAIGSTRDPDLTNDIVDAVMKALPTILKQREDCVIEEIAQRLDTLAAGRMEYVVRPGDKEPETSDDILQLPGLGPVVYGEASAARWLARIVRGDSDRGWLPSWRWENR